MPRVIPCRACGVRLKLPDQFAARRAKCPKCTGLITIEAEPADDGVLLLEEVPSPALKRRPAPRVAKPAHTEFELVEDEEESKPLRNRPVQRGAKPAKNEYELIEDEEEPKPKKRKRIEVEDEPVDKEEEDRPKKKKKRKKRVHVGQYDETVSAIAWWYGGLTGLILLIALGMVVYAIRGHGAEVLFSAICLAITVPVSMVILVISMLLSSALAGGISFGDVGTAIPKAAILLIVINLVGNQIPCPLNGVVMFPIWLIGLMYAFDLDFWEARFLIAINWFLNFLFKWALFAIFISLLMHGKLGPDHHDLEDAPPAAATAQEKAMDAIEKLGGSYDDDPNADDLHIISIHLASSRATDADLVHLKEFPTLRQLDLSNTRITDQGLTHLKGLKQLQLVNLRGTKVTAKGVAELQKALPGAKIVVK